MTKKKCLTSLLCFHGGVVIGNWATFHRNFRSTVFITVERPFSITFYSLHKGDISFLGSSEWIETGHKCPKKLTGTSQ